MTSPLKDAIAQILQTDMSNSDNELLRDYIKEATKRFKHRTVKRQTPWESRNLEILMSEPTSFQIYLPEAIFWFPGAKLWLRS